MRWNLKPAVWLSTVALSLIGCGSPSAPPAEAPSTEVELGAPAETAPPADETPVLPIPDDMPSEGNGPAETPIKPIPDDEPAAPNP